MATYMYANATNATLASPSSLETPFYFTTKSSVIPGISDWYLSHAASPVAYWALSMIFHGLDNSGWKWLDKYRIHESAEYTSRNRATVREVVRAVIIQQIIQVSTGLVLTALDEEPQLGLAEHQSAMMQIAVTMVPILKAIFGERLAASLFTQYGASWAYFAYWWAIPIFKYLVAM
jgi:sphinganine C4-monooxygenase